MARIDSILAVVVQQGANELRMGTNREPKMLAYGAAKRFHMVPTSDEELRELLGEILTDERREALRASRRLDVAYEAGQLGSFRVTLTGRQDGFDAIFLRDRSAAAAKASAAVSAAVSTAARPAPSAIAPEMREPIRPVPPMPQPLVPIDERVTQDAIVPPASVAPPGCAHLLARAAGMRASDLHLIDGDVPVVRVDGQLHRLEDEGIEDVAVRLGLDAAAVSAVSAGRSLDFALTSPDGSRVRANVFRTASGTAAALRFLARTAPSLSSLGLPLPIDDLVELPHGLVVVCGATGSGKSTTLAALAQAALAKRSIVLLTLEDPIEYELSAGPRALVRQRQIGRDVRDFPSGLRDALREDPDVLVLGEMRDAETISLALTAAETGHLVLTTLHSGTAGSAVERIVDAYPAEQQLQVRNQLADSLRAVVAQRLLPRSRGPGRVLAAEILRANHAIGNMIREGKTAHMASVLHAGKREGMMALDRHLADLARAGDIRENDARAAATDMASLAMFMRGAS